MFNQAFQSKGVIRNICVSLLLLTAMNAYPSALKIEEQGLIYSYKSKSDSEISILRKIQGSGHSNSELFELINNSLMDEYSSRSNEISELNSWRVKALAFSGEEKYRKTIAEVVNNSKSRKVKRYAKQSLAILSDYTRWNPVIVNGLSSYEGQLLDSKRIENMLTAKDYRLKRFGAMRVIDRHVHDTEIIEFVVSLVERDYEKISGNGVEADSIAWLCKVLKYTYNLKHLPLLETVRSNSPSKHVRTEAAKAVRKIKFENNKNTLRYN
ncbi:MAG: hypothetical protein ACI93R_003255 [Flavobacteriales bacterium]|jgi:hypothetical protein